MALDFDDTNDLSIFVVIPQIDPRSGTIFIPAWAQMGGGGGGVRCMCHCIYSCLSVKIKTHVKRLMACEDHGHIGFYLCLAHMVSKNPKTPKLSPHG